MELSDIERRKIEKEIEEINDEMERCMNLFPQKDYLLKSFSSKDYDKDGKICFGSIKAMCRG